MSEEQLSNQSVSIMVNLYSSILSGIPNLFHIFTEAKESSYCVEVVKNDIEQSQNAVTVAADDLSTRALMIKFQEKNIPFKLIPAEAVKDHIKTYGRQVFILSESDFSRIVDVVEKAKREFEKPDPEEEQEKEEDLEKERTKDSEEKTDEEENGEEQEETEPEEGEPESEEEKANDKGDSKKEKEKKKKKKKNSSYDKKDKKAYDPGYKSPDYVVFDDASARKQEEEIRQEVERHEKETRDRERKSEETQRETKAYYEKLENERRAIPENNQSGSANHADNNDIKHGHENDYNAANASSGYKEPEPPKRGHAAQADALRDGDRFKEVDFHNHSGENVNSESEAERKNEPAYSDQSQGSQGYGDGSHSGGAKEAGSSVTRQPEKTPEPVYESGAAPTGRDDHSVNAETIHEEPDQNQYKPPEQTLPQNPAEGTRHEERSGHERPGYEDGGYSGGIKEADSSTARQPEKEKRPEPITPDEKSGNETPQRGHAAQTDTLSGSDRFKEVDFHNRSGESGSNESKTEGEHAPNEPNSINPVSKNDSPGQEVRKAEEPVKPQETERKNGQDIRGGYTPQNNYHAGHDLGTKKPGDSISNTSGAAHGAGATPNAEHTDSTGASSPTKGHVAKADALRDANKNKEINFHNRGGGISGDNEIKQNGTAGVTALGNGNAVNYSQGTRNPQNQGLRSGNNLTNGSHSKQSEVFQGKGEASPAGSNQNPDGHTARNTISSSAELKSKIYGSGKEKTDPGNASNGHTPDKRAISVSCVAANRGNFGKTEGGIPGADKYRANGSYGMKGDSGPGKSDNGDGPHDGNGPNGHDGSGNPRNINIGKTAKKPRNNEKVSITDSILRTRRMYQIRNVLSPKNFKKVFSVSRRMVTQTIVSRETDGGQVASNIVDFTSPIAMTTGREFLKSGAIAITNSTKCDFDMLVAAYAVKNKMDLNDAYKELRILRKLDAKLVREGGIGLNLKNDGNYMARLKEAHILSGNASGMLSMLNSMSTQELLDFMGMYGLSKEFQEKILSIPNGNLNAAKIQKLMKLYSMDTKEYKFLETMLAKQMRSEFRGSGGFGTLFARYLTQLFKRMAMNSDGGRALADFYGAGTQVYSAYRAGVRFVMAVLEKFKVIDPNITATKVVMKDPLRALGNRTFSVSRNLSARATKRITRTRAVSALKNSRVARHASSALKFVTKPLNGIKKIIIKRLIDPLKAVRDAAAKKLAGLVAKVAPALGWILIIVLIIIIGSEILLSSQNSETSDEAPANYVTVQDTEIVQEIITELTAKNEAFIAEINNAAYHRGNYASTAGVTSNENVGFYEAYNIVFRDAYGNELEPNHVDLNNTKAIISMATKYMPYPFHKLSDTATDDEKKVYEDLKQHFKDYCYFLWAATHQISIEEYHPGNSDGIEGAVDNSGLATTLDKGKCDKDGTTIWLKDDFTHDLVKYRRNDSWSCDTCGEVPYTGLGTYFDDLCTHGKDSNIHGGWRMTGEKRYAYNCKDAHHVHKDSEGDIIEENTCEEEYPDSNYASPSSHGHWEYEWIYECGGHMGSVVYVTIGDLSRLPGFGAAGDVDYSLVGVYDTGESIIGSTITGTSGVAYTDLTEEQILKITALCIAEQGTNVEGVRAEATLIANKADASGGDVWAVVNSGWFANSDTFLAPNYTIGSSVSNRGTITQTLVDAVKNVIVNGNRAFPSNVLEHDTLNMNTNEIIKIIVDGTEYTDKATINDRSLYVRDKTIIWNRYGSIYTFYCFPYSGADPFGVLTGYWK